MQQKTENAYNASAIILKLVHAVKYYEFQNINGKQT